MFYLVTFGAGKWDWRTFEKLGAARRFVKRYGGAISYGKPSSGFTPIPYRAAHTIPLKN
jgi:hypothetical protein